MKNQNYSSNPFYIKTLLWILLIIGISYLYSAAKVIFINTEIDEFELFFSWKVDRIIFLTIKIILGLFFLVYAGRHLIKKGILK